MCRFAKRLWRHLLILMVSWVIFRSQIFGRKLTFHINVPCTTVSLPLHKHSHYQCGRYYHAASQVNYSQHKSKSTVLLKESKAEIHLRIKGILQVMKLVKNSERKPVFANQWQRNQRTHFLIPIFHCMDRTPETFQQWLLGIEHW